MNAPISFPRVPHLVPGRGTRDDLTLESDEVAALLAREAIVEEKVDGANVSLWLEDGIVRCALRSGPDAMDRAGQLGPLRAWLGSHDEPLRAALASSKAIYGEWLLLRHTVGYDRLPAYLVVLDLWRPTGFAATDERNALAAEVGLAVPPELWRGVPGSVAEVEELLGPSRWGVGPMEGLVLRPIDGGPPRLAKVLRPGFDRVDDEAWRHGRPRNQVGEGASWR